jgi:hypothetical protein
LLVPALEPAGLVHVWRRRARYNFLPRRATGAHDGTPSGCGVPAMSMMAEEPLFVFISVRWDVELLEDDLVKRIHMRA